VVQLLLSLLSMRVMTWALSSSEVGNVYLILSLASYFSLIFLSPVGLYMTRRLHAWHQERILPDCYSRYNLYVLVVSIMAVPAIYAVKALFSFGGGIPTAPLLCAVAAFIYFGTWNSTFIPALNILNYRRPFVLFSTLTLLFSLGFSLLLVISVAKTALLWIAGQITGLLLLSGAAYFYFRDHIWGQASSQRQTAAAAGLSMPAVYKFSFPLLITALFMWLQNQSYRIIVERNLGSEFLGLMAVGLGIAISIGAALESMMQQIYYPIYYKAINTDNQEQRRRAWQRMSAVMLPMYLLAMIFVSFMSGHLAIVLVDAKFRAAAFFTVFGAWMEFARIATNMLSNVAHSEMRTNYLAKPYIYGGVISVAGVLAGTSSPGYRYAVPAAMVFGALSTLLLMLFSMRRIMPLNISRGGLKLALLLSLPMPAALFFPAEDFSIRGSLLVLAVFSSYLAGAQYFLYKYAVPGPMETAA